MLVGHARDHADALSHLLHAHLAVARQQVGTLGDAHLLPANAVELWLFLLAEGRHLQHRSHVALDALPHKTQTDEQRHTQHAAAQSSQQHASGRSKHHGQLQVTHLALALVLRFDGGLLLLGLRGLGLLRLLQHALGVHSNGE